jgi:hypothetical protein
MTPDDLGSYAVTLDPAGKELSRQKLETTASEGGLASPMGANMPDEIVKFFQSGKLRPLPLPAEIKFPDLQPRANAYRPGESEMRRRCWRTSMAMASRPSLHAGDNTLQYSKPDPNNPTGPWITTTVSEPGPWGSFIGHGLGVGDINGDGLNDVMTSLEGHGYGLAWYEQKRDSNGKISFVKRPIMDNFLTKNAGDVTFTEPHATAYADMNGDGIPDLITGKRSMAHLFDYGDPDPFGPAVLYVYTVVRDPKAPGGAKFVPTLVHNMSGVGSHISVVDLNGDGKPEYCHLRNLWNFCVLQPHEAGASQ